MSAARWLISLIGLALYAMLIAAALYGLVTVIDWIF